ELSFPARVYSQAFHRRLRHTYQWRCFGIFFVDESGTAHGFRCRPPYIWISFYGGPLLGGVFSLISCKPDADVGLSRHQVSRSMVRMSPVSSFANHIVAIAVCSLFGRWR